MDFQSLRLRPNLLRGVADLGFDRPTPIQRDAVPPALEGRDVLGCAMTGSGKTAAFLLPILHRLAGKKRGTTRALILAPTRELAAQIVEHCNELARYTSIRAAAVYGGVGMQPQERALRRGVDVIVACPGRLLDHMSRHYARFDGLEVLVLDEADRMLDMGFLPDIRRILDRLPPLSQTLLFSATLPPPIVALSRRLLRDPVRINVERRSAPATGVRQSIYPVPHELKSALLLEMLERDEITNALVFTRTKHRADRLARYLDRRGVACDRVHGNRSQSQRDHALSSFKSGRYRVLVATDVAARGIDIEALSHVVNFDVPNLPDDYIHRVGRTARAGATGEALTFVSPQERREIGSIEQRVGKNLPRRTLAGFDYKTRTGERLEIPLGERLAAIRARKAEDRARAKARAERKSAGRHQARNERATDGDAKPRRPRKPRRRRQRSKARPAAAQTPRDSSTATAERAERPKRSLSGRPRRSRW